MRRTIHRILGAGLVACLAVLPAGCGSSTSSSTSSPEASNTSTAVAQAGGAWPAPQDQAYQSCPPEGDGGDPALNLRKNRIDTGAWQVSSVSDIVNLAYPQSVAKQPRATWSADDAAAVARYEGRPLQIDGYMLLVRHEGTESPNCHDANARDFHMWLAGQPGTRSDRASSMIVEVTPRVRARNANWQPDSRLLGLTGHHVRISGWLMLDQEHPEQVGKTRGTLWEIHPVLKIEVEQGGQWIDLNNQSLSISGGSPNSPSYGSSGSSTSSGTAHHRQRHRHRHPATPTPDGNT